MKIGILTLPLHGNIGGVLQNYALIHFLEKNGHEVYTLDYRPHKHEIIKAYIFRLVSKLRLKKFTYRLFYKNNKLKLLINIREFIDSKIPLRGPYYSFNALKKASKKYDAIIVGSDQVWRKIFISDSLNIYYLGFTNNKQIRLSYAASIGTDICEYTEMELTKINQFIKSFKAISVREQSAISLIQNTYKWNCPLPQLVLDPTFLLKDYEYLNLIHNTNTIKYNNKYIYNYILDNSEEKIEVLNKFSTLLNLELQSSYNIISKRVTPSIEQWLSDILNSEFVITDSFHGVVFSIIFKKQFAVFINNERGRARFNSLLNIFELNNRIINNNIESLITNKINYDHIQKIKDTYLNKSIIFLNENLQK